MSLATSRCRHWEQGLPSPDATVPSPGSRTPSPAAPDPRAGPSARASQRFPSSCSYGSQINAAASHGAVFRITQAFKLTPRERGPVACWLRVPREEGAAARSGGCQSPREGRPHGRRCPESGGRRGCSSAVTAVRVLRQTFPGVPVHLLAPKMLMCTEHNASLGGEIYLFSLFFKMQNLEESGISREHGIGK